MHLHAVVWWATGELARDTGASRSVAVALVKLEDDGSTQ